MVRALLTTALICAAIYAVLVLGLQRRAIYPRFGGAPARLPQVPGLERWQLGPDAQVDAFFLPPHTSSAGSPSPALIFAHGNGELIDMWAQAFELPRSWGMAVLLVEYPGYGRSGGSPSESSISAVFDSAYVALLERDDVDAARIVGYGRSLGGGAVCALSTKRELSALILESAFTGLAPLAAGLYVPSPLLLDRFDNLAAVQGFERPILLIHGSNDQIIPSHHAETLHAAAANSQLHLQPCGHNDCPQRWDLIGSFLYEAGVLNRAPKGAIQP